MAGRGKGKGSLSEAMAAIQAGGQETDDRRRKEDNDRQSFMPGPREASTHMPLDPKVSIALSSVLSMETIKELQATDFPKGRMIIDTASKFREELITILESANWPGARDNIYHLSSHLWDVMYQNLGECIQEIECLKLQLCQCQQAVAAMAGTTKTTRMTPTMARKTKDAPSTSSAVALASLTEKTDSIIELLTKINETITAPNYSAGLRGTPVMRGALGFVSSEDAPPS